MWTDIDYMDNVRTVYSGVTLFHTSNCTYQEDIPVTALIRRTFNYRSQESLVHIPCMYRSLTKECTWLERLTSLPKSCGGRYSFDCFHIYNHERVPMSCVTVTQCPWSKWLDKEQSYLWLQSWVLMAQNTLNGITSPWAWCSSWWVPHKYVHPHRATFSKVWHTKFLTSDTVAVILKLHKYTH